jgi:hypothetical protein
MSTNSTVVGTFRAALAISGQAVQPLVGHGDHADVGLDGGERVVRRLGAGGADGVEEGGLADVGQPDDGFSMGGHTALALAAKRPEVCDSLTLVGVSTRPHAGLDAWRARFDPDRFAAEYPLWVRQLSELHEPQGGPDAWAEVMRRDAGGVHLDVDLDALGRLEAPVLLVRGDRDPAVDPAQYAQLRAVWPHAEEMVVPAGGHDVQLTRARIVEPALRDFLRRALADRMDG